MADQITSLAYRLLDGPIEAVPRYRLLRDVLLWPLDKAEMVVAREAAMRSRLISELVQAQQPDGSFGRFYSRNKRIRYAGRTTETALIRALSLGMTGDHPMLVRMKNYMEAVLLGEADWPDHPDPSLDWPIAKKLVTAARLRHLDPDNELARLEASRCVKLVEATFAEDYFDELEFTEAYEDIFNQPAEHGTRMLFSLYGLLLVQGLLPYPVEQRLTHYLIKESRGVYLISNRSLGYTPLTFESRESLRYIRALELLSGFPSSAELLTHAADWLWEQMNNNGLWDLGHLGRDGLELPLSDSWRGGQRPVDCSVALLCLLMRLQRTCDLNDRICHNL